MADRVQSTRGGTASAGATPTAVILVAGRGTRLGDAAEGPKCLAKVGGRPLLSRYLIALGRRDVPVRLVLGHRADDVRRHLDDAHPGQPVEVVINPDYRRGSIVSLDAGLAGLDGAALILDGDVFFEDEVMARLLETDHENALAVDFTHRFTDEEYMAGVTDGRVRSLTRGPAGPEYEESGEWVGFSLWSGEAVSALRARLSAELAAGRLGGGYEDELAALLDTFHVHAVPVDGTEWIEIDFPEDLAHAERLARRR